MFNNLVYLILLLTAITVYLVVYLKVYHVVLNKENFQNYKMNPFGEVKTGNDPLYFYNYNRYRKPYRWPFRYYSSYPYPHMSPLK